ncbi:MAG: DUF4743 domain-containing protein [Acetobacteraceae bacterium]
MDETGFARHVRACNNASLPGNRTPLWVCGVQVGWLTPAVATALDQYPQVRRRPDGGLSLQEPAKLPEIARDLAHRGLYRWRGEAFDVRADMAGPSLAQIDRGALPSFGIAAHGVHVNGLVSRREDLNVWVARRARDKALDPGKLDHVVAGGVPAGLGALETLIKEAEEEASIPPDLAVQAVPVAMIRYVMERPEGLRRDVLTCYDLELPVDFTPVAADGEVEAFELWPVAQVLETVRDTDDFKFNVNLVLIDLFIRRGLIGSAEASGLRTALTVGRV